MKKKIVIVLLILITIIFTIIFITSNNSNKVGSAGISLEEFNKINLGISQNSVLKIIDINNLLDDNSIYNKVVTEVSKSNENHIYTYQYKYLGENGGYAIITYTADYSNGDLFVLPIVSNKENFNLK